MTCMGRVAVSVASLGICYLPGREITGLPQTFLDGGKVCFRELAIRAEAFCLGNVPSADRSDELPVLDPEMLCELSGGESARHAVRLVGDGERGRCAL